MAKKFVFCVFDSKAQAYLQPFFSMTRGTALRSFMDAVEQEGHEFRKHASDYTLFELGEFDELKGEFSMYEAKVNLGVAAQFLGGELRAVEGGE